MHRITCLGGIFIICLWTCGDVHPQGNAPAEAARKMTVADGFQVQLVAAEPVIRQPVAIDFDERGRLWVIQYLQYPNPAGLKRVKVDRYSRTVYDRVPEPPPHGPKGADRLTILEEKNGKLVAKDFLSDLNLASGFAFGHGGVFVLQTPYLLFYPDRDRDDVPDGDPDVLLSGFGMEDAHSVANSLTWGPDGWLYGCQGSTVTANIRGIEFQQGVWRYHPITRKFELFCEGGGNSWGLDFDRHGHLLYSTNVGGFHMLHGVQGGYYWKQFGKHGALHNPHAYGYFDHVPHRNFRGGHVTVGGVIYQGDSFPERFRGKYIAADLLGHAVYWHDLEATGSSFRSSHGGELLLANDTWFAPSDVALGPDGAVYVADWHDKRTAHPDPDADWDRRNGRIYKVSYRSPASPERQRRVNDPSPPLGASSDTSLAKLSSDKLVALLSHPNDWYVRKARQTLAERRDPEVIFPLRTLIAETKNDQLALQALWALYVSGGFDERVAEKLLEHRNPDVRRWTVSFLGDERKVSAGMAQRLAELAGRESNAIVRSQLACSARRLPATDCLRIVKNLSTHSEDRVDPHIPLLLWWAVEEHAVSGRRAVLQMLSDADVRKLPLFGSALHERLMRRYAAEGSAAGYESCNLLLAAEADVPLLMALDQGLQERPSEKRATGMPPQLRDTLENLWKDNTTDLTLLRLMTRLGKLAAHKRALALALDTKTFTPLRVELVQLLGEVGGAGCIAPLLSLVTSGQPEPVQLAAVRAVQRFDRQEVGSKLLERYPQSSGKLRSLLVEALLSRKLWALHFLTEIERGKFAAKDVAVDQLRSISLHQDKRLDDLVRKHWGNIQGGTPEEKLAEVRRFNNDLRAGSGDPLQGRLLFQKHCAVCHRLFDEGNLVGPDLTHANRKDRDYLLVSIVDPGAIIRKEFLAYNVQTSDGRLLTGLIVDQSPSSITLVDGKNERTKIDRGKIESLSESPVSLMPENQLKDLKPQELRDLFSYLQK